MWWFGALTVLLLGILWAVWAWNTRPVVLIIDVEPPAGFPEVQFSHDSFEQLLRRHVSDDGLVDYQTWHDNAADMHLLAQYLAAVAAYSPENAPDRFATSNDRLVYWINVYNAFVIKSVLDRWPLGSVTDVKAPLELVRGLGFFYKLRFIAGGETYSLLNIEMQKVRRPSRDPRIHFVLNCGSESCPMLLPDLPTGDELEAYLEQAARRFVSEDRNVEIDDANRTIHLSTIFKWFRRDFVSDLRRRGLPADRGLVDYLVHVAPEPRKSKLLAARDYELVFRDYDWDVNVSGAEPAR